MTENFQLEEPWWRRFPILPAGIGVLLLVGVGALLFRGGDGRGKGRQIIAATGVKQVGTIVEPGITECSGIVASRKHPGIFWVHNDGNRERLWAIRADGTTVAEYKVEARGTDWEDIAADEEGNLYIADVGNNVAGEKESTGEGRRDIEVFQVKEPNPDKKGKKLDVERSWKLNYPDAAFDCEALVVHGGHGYLISKTSRNRPAVLYRFDLAEKEQTLERLGTLDFSQPVTGASISPDGMRMAVLTQSAVHVYRIDGDATQVLRVRPTAIQIMGKKFEGVGFADDGLLVTAESREVMLVPKSLYEK